MARTACLVCFISTVNGRSKKEEKKAIMSCASSGHITKLKQSIFAFRYLYLGRCSYLCCSYLALPRLKLVDVSIRKDQLPVVGTNGQCYKTFYGRKLPRAYPRLDHLKCASLR